MRRHLKQRTCCRRCEDHQDKGYGTGTRIVVPQVSYGLIRCAVASAQGSVPSLGEVSIFVNASCAIAEC